MTDEMGIADVHLGEMKAWTMEVQVEEETECCIALSYLSWKSQKPCEQKK